MNFLKRSLLLAVSIFSIAASAVSTPNLKALSEPEALQMLSKIDTKLRAQAKALMNTELATFNQITKQIRTQVSSADEAQCLAGADAACDKMAADFQNLVDAEFSAAGLSAVPNLYEDGFNEAFTQIYQIRYELTEGAHIKPSPTFNEAEARVIVLLSKVAVHQKATSAYTVGSMALYDATHVQEASKKFSLVQLEKAMKSQVNQLLGMIDYVLGP